MSKKCSLLQNVSDVSLQLTQLKSNTFGDSEVKVAHHSSARIENQSSLNPWHRQARSTGEHGGTSRSARQADKRVNRYNTNDANGDDDDSKETRETTDSHFTMIVHRTLGDMSRVVPQIRCGTFMNLCTVRWCTIAC